MKEAFTLEMNDGHQIAATAYYPEGDAKGHIHILHGMAEHQKRYVDFAELLAANGYFVTSHDHRGHGDTAELNGGLYGFFAEQDGFNRVVQDVHEVIQHFRKMKPDLEFTLFGHSMGSFIARSYTQLHSEQIDKAIYCGTGATTALHQAGHKLAISLSKLLGAKTPSRIMNRMSFGSFNKKVPDPVTNFDWLSTDAGEVAKYIEDMQCGFIATNQFFVDLTEGLIAINKKSEIDRIRKDLPILLVAGSDDPVGEYGKGVYQVASQLEQAGVENVSVYLFEGMRHEILNERNKQLVHDVILRWLERGML